MRVESKLLRSSVIYLLTMGLAVSGALAKKQVSALQAQSEVDEGLLLDVGIQILDPGLPEEDEDALEEQRIFADVRKSEARFLPYHLKNTLEATGHWGAVRVIPRTIEAGDLLVSGEILLSNGKTLAIRLNAVDSTGVVWLEKKYKEEADPAAYDDDTIESFDPYQNVFNRIANDLVEFREKLTAEEVEQIRETTWLRFAADLAPTVFGDYVSINKKGRVELERLPAGDDPMLERLAGVRERDYLFVDTLNQYYDDFYRRMGNPYFNWRKNSYDELIMLRGIRREALAQKLFGIALIGVAVVASDPGVAGAAGAGGAIVVKSGFEKSKEAKLNKEALKELAASFDAEIAPVLVEVEGQTLRLEGSAETQFAEWRRMLADIFETETGLPPRPDAEGPTDDPAEN